MKYLFIDSATATLVVAIIIDDKITYIYNQKVGKDMSSVIILERDGKIIRQKRITEQKENSKLIMPTVKKVLNKEKPDSIIVVNGPGSFTGIRVGLTVAKMMSWALNIPVVPLSSLEVIASTPTSENNIALIDARRGFVYAGVYDNDLNVIMEDKHMELAKLNIDGQIVSYDDFAGIKPNLDILKVIKKHEKDKDINPHKLNPKYLKLTEAEEKLNRQNDNGSK